MSEIRFYHLTRTDLDRALPELLEKCHQRGWRAVVMAGSAERVQALDTGLWTYRPNAFLPHGTSRDGDAEEQPIWLTDRDENPNGATVLFLTDGARSDRVAEYALVCELFDGRDPEAVATARERWRAYRTAGHALAYWQQTEHGQWREKQRREASGEG